MVISSDCCDTVALGCVKKFLSFKDILPEQCEIEPSMYEVANAQGIYKTIYFEVSTAHLASEINKKFGFIGLAINISTNKIHVASPGSIQHL